MPDHHEDQINKLKAMTNYKKDSVDMLVAHYRLLVAEAKEGFGEWDPQDPVVHALLGVVITQNEFAHTLRLIYCEGFEEALIEQAITARAKAIAALLKALKQEPRGFQ
jgi:hypothetical protein